ncbi:serine hydrolase [Granulicatella seriolae]|uniref:Class A beta-lactamase-related serine hydrolase n=1 Tax=Granulicatella seriolae TaxID=2967226 RepID=A0ABT1WMK4_9LACT|nr:serine hydrolase [Granulicatella seriolae]
MDKVRLISVLEEQLKAAPFEVAVAMDFSPSDNEPFFVQKNRQFHSASMLKLFIVGTCFQEIEAGRLSLSQQIPIPSHRVGGGGPMEWMPSIRKLSLEELLALTIVYSDNDTSNYLIDLLGIKTIQKWIDAHGFGQTRIERKFMDYVARDSGLHNYTSVGDCYRFFKLLAKGELASKESNQKMMHFLLNQANNGKIPRFLNPSILFAHKTGEMDGIEHDGGILIKDDKQLVFCVLTHGECHSNQLINWISDFSRTYFDMVVYEELGLDKESV